MLLVYPECLGRAISEEVFKQLASVINFRRQLTSHVTLGVVSALGCKNLVVSSGIGVNLCK